MRTGIATLPLHGGKAPAWLFARMVKLARAVTLVMVEQFGPPQLLARLSDPFWFQAFGCLLGFDWHSSGVTTTVCGALKEGVKGLEKELGLFPAGGKGRVSRQTPQEIAALCEKIGQEAGPLIYASRMTAKVDSAALQDGYQIYHHFFLFTQDGRWAVIQQGMNEQTRYARRYHWLSERTPNLVVEPHAAICCDAQGLTLNMVAEESEPARVASAFLSQEKPETVLAEIKKIKALALPGHHQITLGELDEKRLATILLKTYEAQPSHFEALLSLPGVGPKTIRALALLSELLYGAKASLRDPARFSFAHGGKDGHPYPVDKDTYGKTIQFLHDALLAAKMGYSEKLQALRRLTQF